MGHTAGFVSHKSVYDVTKSPDRGSFSSFALSARREEQTYMLPLPFNSSHSLPQASRAVFCLHVHSDPLVSRFQRRIDRRLWLLLVNHGFDALASATTLSPGSHASRAFAPLSDSLGDPPPPPEGRAINQRRAGRTPFALHGRSTTSYESLFHPRGLSPAPPPAVSLSSMMRACMCSSTAPSPPLSGRRDFKRSDSLPKAPFSRCFDLRKSPGP